MSRFNVADVVPENKTFEAFAVGREDIKDTPNDGPIKTWASNTGSGNRADPHMVDDDWGVDMRFRIRWHGKEQAAPFVHAEVAGEVWVPIPRQEIFWTAHGENWDRRTMILHPAVAPLAVTDAGFDQAYLSALAASHSMMGQPQRADMHQTARDHLGVMLQQSIGPFRLLLRGAALWHALSQGPQAGTTAVPLFRSRGMRDPRPIWTPQQFSSALQYHSDHPHDCVYIKIDERGELPILNAIVAMTSDDFPLAFRRESIGAIWPAMKCPTVYYTAQWAVAQTAAPISRVNVWNALCRLADTYDCWDLLDEALRTVAAMTHRPTGMPTWMGRSKFTWNLPESRMQAGICGPLYSGVSAQGMKTSHFPEPDIKVLLVEGCIRASFILAGAGLHLTYFLDSHYAIRGVKKAEKPLLSSFGSIAYSRQFNDKCGSMASELGWFGAMGRSLREIRVPPSSVFVKALLNSSAYPSTSVLLPWLNKARGGADMSALMKPAIPMVPARMDGWQSVSMFGSLNEHELAASIMRIAAEVRFSVKLRNGASLMVRGPEQMSFNRALPLLTPSVNRSDLRIRTQVRIHKPLAFLKTRVWCSQLREAHVVVEKLLASEADPEFFEEDEWDIHDVNDKDIRLATEEDLEGEKYLDSLEDESTRTDGPDQATPAPAGLPPTRTVREQGAILEKYSPLRLHDLIGGDILQQHSVEDPGREKRRETVRAFLTEEPQQMLLEVPKGSRRALAVAISDFVAQIAHMGGTTADSMLAAKVSRQYAAAAQTMEHGGELTAEELAINEELRSGGTAPIDAASDALATAVEQVELGGEKEAYESVKESVLLADLAEKAEASGEQSFLGLDPSGPDISTHASGTDTPEVAAASAVPTSTLPVGVLGFSDKL